MKQALREDLREGGDITTQAVLPVGREASASLITREACRLAGIDLAEAAFRIRSEKTAITLLHHDGDMLEADAPIMRIEGSAAAILSAERVALNFLAHLSGIATATARLVEMIAESPAKLCCTRKTTPGLRVLEKYAVRMGGGINHRAGLDDAILIKDNHLALGIGIKDAVRRARAHMEGMDAGGAMKLEVEVDNLEGLEEALEAGAEAILLDNFSPQLLRHAVKKTAKRASLEASGGITAKNIRQTAATGVDFISVGWITHSAPALDMSLEMEEREKS